jgi:Fucosyltransferase, N-terminal
VLDGDTGGGTVGNGSRMLKDLVTAVQRKVRLPAIAGSIGHRAPSNALILFFNTMWGQPVDTTGAILPDGWRLTTDIRCLKDAAAVVFHLPSLDQLPSIPKTPGQLWVAWSMECETNHPQLADSTYMGVFARQGGPSRPMTGPSGGRAATAIRRSPSRALSMPWSKITSAAGRHERP